MYEGFEPLSGLFVSTAYHHGVAVVTLAGDVDAFAIEPLCATLASVLYRQPTSMVIDLSGVSSLGAAGVSVLLITYADAHERDTRLALVTGHTTVLKVLSLTATDTLFAVFPTLTQALNAAWHAEAELLYRLPSWTDSQ